MSSMTEIHQAGPADLPRLYGLIQSLGYAKEEGYFERCLAEQAEGKRHVYIASFNGVDVGYGLLNWNPQYALYRRLGMPEIQDLNVLHDARRNGIATAIIVHCENAAQAAGKTHMGISVGLYSDYGPAQRLYVKMGYIPDGHGITYDRQPVRPGEIRPVDDDLCLMMLKEL
jgi:GNAT superfamily N-acetyltransferase